MRSIHFQASSPFHHVIPKDFVETASVSWIVLALPWQSWAHKKPFAVLSRLFIHARADPPSLVVVVVENPESRYCTLILAWNPSFVHYPRCSVAFVCDWLVGGGTMRTIWWSHVGVMDEKGNDF